MTVPAFAGQDIAWTWNSGDHDSQAKFESSYDNFYAYEYAGSNYMDYSGGDRFGLRWEIPGDADKTKKTLYENFREGSAVTMQVCQRHTFIPDDCSATKNGVA